MSYDHAFITSITGDCDPLTHPQCWDPPQPPEPKKEAPVPQAVVGGPDKLDRGSHYMLRDRYPGVGGQDLWMLRAEWTGETRPPDAGEWYLSGAIIEAYRASHNMTVAYPIARIVKGTKHEHWTWEPFDA